MGTIEIPNDQRGRNSLVLDGVTSSHGFKSPSALRKQKRRGLFHTISTLTNNLQITTVNKMLEKIDLIQIGELFDSRLKSIEKSLKNLEASSRKTSRNMDIIIRTFDNEYLSLRERIELLEDKVGITR